MNLSDRMKNVSIRRHKKFLADLRNEDRELPQRDPCVPPQSPFDLVRDLKAAFDDGSVLDEGFFTDERLKSFSGARSIDRAGTKFYLTIDDIVESVRVGSFAHCGIQYSFSKWVEDDKYFIRADISFLEFQPTLNFSSIISLFGSNWEDADKVPPPASRKFKPTSHPMGNRKIRFISRAERTTRKSTLDFNSDGTLRGIMILQESA